MKYKVDIGRTEIHWRGFQPDASQHGRIFIEDGYISVDEDKLLKGKVVIDMQSINVLSENLNSEQKQKLTEHLKSIDFFDVDIYPESRFTIEHIKPLDEEEAVSCSTGILQPTHWVYGELLLKGNNASIHFPAKVIVDDMKLSVEASVAINRIDWGLDFMTEESYGNKRILSKVEIDIILVAHAMKEAVPVKTQTGC